MISFGYSHPGQYKILDKVGDGTYGEVHKAIDTRTNNVVALKKIKLQVSEQYTFESKFKFQHLDTRRGNSKYGY